MGHVLAHQLSRIPQLNGGDHERAIRNLARWEEDTVSGERGVMPAPAARKRASSRSSFPGFLLEARGNDEKAVISCGILDYSWPLHNHHDQVADRISDELHQWSGIDS